MKIPVRVTFDGSSFNATVLLDAEPWSDEEEPPLNIKGSFSKVSVLTPPKAGESFNLQVRPGDKFYYRGMMTDDGHFGLLRIDVSHP